MEKTEIDKVREEYLQKSKSNPLYLEGLKDFNLGVSLAHQEFMEWLDEKFLYLRALGKDEEYQRLFADKSYELKKSLSEDKT